MKLPKFGIKEEKARRARGQKTGKENGKPQKGEKKKNARHFSVKGVLQEVTRLFWF